MTIRSRRRPRKTSGTIGWTFESVMADGSDVNVEINYTAWPEVPESDSPAEPAHAEITSIKPISLTTEIGITYWKTTTTSWNPDCSRITTAPIPSSKVALFREWSDSLVALDELLEHRILDECLADACSRDTDRSSMPPTPITISYSDALKLIAAPHGTLIPLPNSSNVSNDEQKDHVDLKPPILTVKKYSEFEGG
jgi:hypothetical protein